MTIVLMVLSIAAVLALVGVLVYFLVRIIKTLESIGGRPPGYSGRLSGLGKIALGVRAIEQQTSHLGPEVTRLNASLDQASAGLQSIDNHLIQTIEAVQRQGRSR